MDEVEEEGRVDGRGKAGWKGSMTVCGGIECLKRSWHEACMIVNYNHPNPNHNTSTPYIQVELSEMY